MKKGFLIMMFLASGAWSAYAMAKEKSSAVYSPNCSAEDIRALAKDALVRISKNKTWGDNTKGFIVTLDLEQMSFSELTKKMHVKGCFTP